MSDGKCIVKYLRLSLEDEDMLDESNSITNQRIVIGQYIASKNEFKNTEVLEFKDPDFISEKYVKDGQIKRLDVAGCPVTVWTQLLLHKNKWRSPAINVFVEFYKEVMQR